MTTGIFRPTPTNGLAFRARQQAERRRRSRGPTLNAFADALADGATVKEAAARVGVSVDYGRAMLGRIRKQLGWQAS